MAQLSMMLRLPSMRTGILALGLCARNSGLCCSPDARLMCFTVISPNSAPASISSSSMMLTFQPFGVADVQSSMSASFTQIPQLKKCLTTSAVRQCNEPPQRSWCADDLTGHLDFGIVLGLNLSCLCLTPDQRMSPYRHSTPAPALPQPVRDRQFLAVLAACTSPKIVRQLRSEAPLILG